MSPKEQELSRLVEKQREYINLLVEELDELVSIASVHGWKSSRVEEGERLRSEISSLESGLNKQ